MHKEIICIVAGSGDSIALEIAMVVTKKFRRSYNPRVCRCGGLIEQRQKQPMSKTEEHDVFKIGEK